MRKKTKKVSFTIAVVTIVIISLMLLGNSKVQTSLVDTSIYDSFAQCIADNGAEMYGAYWCPVCNAQKNLFGSSEKNLPYIECSLQNSRTQTLSCRRAGIEAYPTWKFADGTEYVGQLSLEDLAVRTNCELPTEHQMPVSSGTSTLETENKNIEKLSTGSSTEEVVVTEETDLATSSTDNI